MRALAAVALVASLTVGVLLYRHAMERHEHATACLRLGGVPAEIEEYRVCESVESAQRRYGYPAPGR